MGQLVRVIAGKAGGRRLTSPDTQRTRPVTDRVREAIFSIIGSWVEGATVLDLYAGSGSFGLEALSRGADRAVFVENGSKALGALRKNVADLNLGGDVVHASVQDYLKRTSATFDLVFIDPPWPMPSDELGLDLVALDGFVGPKAEIVVSRRHTDLAPEIPKNWRLATEKRYGDTRIFRYEKE